MTELVTMDKASDVAFLMLNAPPSNILTPELRAAFIAKFTASVSDDAVKKIMIAGQGRSFSTGLDLRELDNPKAPTMRELTTAMEECAKPVCVALHGTIAGAAASLALAAHYRICSPSLNIGFPDLSTALIPTGGATQRLPRLVGADASLDMFLNGRFVNADQALELGLVDEIHEVLDAQAAIEFAHSRTDVVPVGPQRKKLQNGQDFMVFVNVWRDQVRKKHAGVQAPEAIIECVEAALLLPFEAGLDLEDEHFENCRSSRESFGLRHAFIAEHATRSAKVAPKREERAKIGLAGVGPHTLHLAENCLRAGLPVVFYESDPIGIATILEKLADAEAEEKPVFSGKYRDKVLRDLNVTGNVEDLKEANLVVETQSDESPDKLDFLKRLASRISDDALLLSQTNYLEPRVLCEASGLAERTLACNLRPLISGNSILEFAMGPKAPQELASQLAPLEAALNRKRLEVGATAGFVSNRLLARLHVVCDQMLALGATPAGVDSACRNIGFSRGPFEFFDQIGLRALFHLRRQLAFSGISPTGDAILKSLCREGFGGKTAGQGYHAYLDPKGLPKANRTGLELMREIRMEHRLATQKIEAQDITDRILAAFVVESAELLGKHDVLTDKKIDLISIKTLGYPRVRGGPLFEADMMTPFTVAQKIKTWMAEGDPTWSVPAYLDRIAKERSRFSVGLPLAQTA